jgi:hypothetical protein
MLFSGFIIVAAAGRFERMNKSAASRAQVTSIRYLPANDGVNHVSFRR